jgi:hypothetical protein
MILVNPKATFTSNENVKPFDKGLEEWITVNGKGLPVLESGDVAVRFRISNWSKKFILQPRRKTRPQAMYCASMSPPNIDDGLWDLELKN